MHPLVFADDFLASSLLTLLMPTLLLTALVVWYVRAMRRHPGNEPVPAPRQQRAPSEREAGSSSASAADGSAQG